MCQCHQYSMTALWEAANDALLSEGINHYFKSKVAENKGQPDTQAALEFKTSLKNNINSRTDSLLQTQGSLKAI